MRAFVNIVWLAYERRVATLSAGRWGGRPRDLLGQDRGDEIVGDLVHGLLDDGLLSLVDRLEEPLARVGFEELDVGAQLDVTRLAIRVEHLAQDIVADHVPDLGAKDVEGDLGLRHLLTLLAGEDLLDPSVPAVDGGLLGGK